MSYIGKKTYWPGEIRVRFSRPHPFSLSLSLSLSFFSAALLEGTSGSLFLLRGEKKKKNSFEE